MGFELTTLVVIGVDCTGSCKALFLYYPLANEVAKGYNNATFLPSVRPSVTSLGTL
jgi:hypothetical protein